MSHLFDFKHPPFDNLTETECARVEAAIDLVYFPAGSVILAQSHPVDSLYVVMKGKVGEYEGQDCSAVYAANDSFDARALVTGLIQVENRAIEDTLAWQIPRELVLELTQSNLLFAAFFYQNVAQKLSVLAHRPMQRELRPALMSKVSQTYLTPPLWLTDQSTVLDAARLMREHHANTVLLRGPHGPGIFTQSNLRDVVIDGRNPADTPLADYAQHALITVDEDDYVFEAMLVMARHTIQRVLVKRGDEIIGLLEQVNLLSYLSNNSQIVAAQIERACSIDELKGASDSMRRLVDLLSGSGVKVTLIAGLVSELHRQLLARLFALLAPADMLNHVCLLALGSEGRGEQIQPTDQDNALIIADGYSHPDLADVCQRFNDALVELGYPRCPGGIMVQNLFWRRSETGFKQAINDWIDTANGANVMHLAIWLDARPVAGQTALLENLRSHLNRYLSGNAAYCSRFAFPIEQFEIQPSLFSQLLGSGDSNIDLKKAGIFPIVHGVRSLALEHHVSETNTYRRIEVLAQRTHLSATVAQDLAESLAFLQGLYLRFGLQARQRGEAVVYLIAPEQLTTLERDLLKDTLKVVKQFRALIRQRYHLQVL
ncbi:DUF294 nucleotidyltransferase-like domain-containing protein [Andreprevotia chitinilytica]|uniref:DUF294 nucleotidyltransferase-like domain-containing protein n=1 Tax=Andreprevotia chitinilytica TaxID=396808 RepID=UPI000553A142|nr:DUF294 nucleotidyltransferase-like domain-containing protein [Andreprevotia chitinilytica]